MKFRVIPLSGLYKSILTSIVSRGCVPSEEAEATYNDVYLYISRGPKTELLLGWNYNRYEDWFHRTGVGCTPYTRISANAAPG
jgi:hypothetical protein